MEKFAYQSKTLYQRLSGHFKTVCTHKLYVAQGCFKCGMYMQGIMHDLSKFSPCEFSVGIKYYDGHRSPNAVQRMVNDGCSTSWLHHKGRNKHHFEYWIDFASFQGKTVFGNKMPMKYVAEMVCDRRAACIAYQGKDYTPASAWNHYLFTRDIVVMHPDTRAVLEKCLLTMKDEGEEACFAYVRQLLSITKGTNYTAKSLGISDI